MGTMSLSPGQAHSDVVEIIGTVSPVTVLRLKSVDVERIEEDLRARIDAAPLTFLYAPVIVDLARLEGDALDLPLHHLAERLRACKLVPLGAANLPAMAVWNAAASGMAVVNLGDRNARPVDPEKSQPLGAEPPPAESPAVSTSSTMTIRQPVRSGQVIYAQNADLVVLGPVNAGAQVVADGHIHIYGPLRGYAYAGAQGTADARIFCDSLEAELVAVAGHYLVADDIPREHRGRRAQLYVDGNELRIQQ
jgi:septum site-determining protein MinC